MIMQRRQVSWLEVPQILFIARAGGHSVVQQRMVLDLAVMAAVKGLF